MEKMPDDPVLAMTIANVHGGVYSPIVGLGKMARRGYFFVGGVEAREEFVPGYRQFHLDLHVGEWVYNVDKGAVRTTTVTNIGGIAILSGLFGNLDMEDERFTLSKTLTTKRPPYFAWKEIPTLQEHAKSQFDFFVRPELISQAQLHPESVTGAIHVVKPPENQIEPIGQGIYNCFQNLKPEAIVRIDGTALFNLQVEPDSFEDIPTPYRWPRK